MSKENFLSEIKPIPSPKDLVPEKSSLKETLYILINNTISEKLSFDENQTLIGLSPFFTKKEIKVIVEKVLINVRNKDWDIEYKISRYRDYIKFVWQPKTTNFKTILFKIKFFFM